MKKLNALFNQSEAQVLRSICLYLKMKNRFFWRAPNVGIYDAKRKAYRVPQFVIKGVPDIFCMAFNIWYAIECKSTTGKQSLDQKYFQEKFTKHGGVYIIARRIEDLQKAGL